ncbi:MAG: o-succinylbenzoate--CoA ligase [Deltaproteobacteria bacterium]|nr:o-succinylbenzoate--CoA ligase [Deltaproteobacteria bacterium]
MTEIRCPLEQAAERHAGRPAVVSGARIVTYAEFHQRVAGVAAVLRQAGCSPGERVAILAPNSPDYLVWLLAVLRLGAVCCPMNTRLPYRTVADLLRRVDCRWLVTKESEWKGLGDLTGDVRILEGRELAEAGGPAGGDGQGCTVPLDRPATIVFTSGSTGTPKAVLHSYGNHYYNALGSNTNLPLEPGDRWLLDLPLYHVGGLGILFRSLLAGSTVVMPDRDETLDSVLSRYQVTHLSVVVTQLHRLLQQPDSVRYPALRYIILGGSPVPLKLLERAAARGLPVFASYGCTEMASQVATTGPVSTTAQRLTSGKLLPHRRLRIGEEGEIQLAGETLFMGYVEGGKLRRPLTDDGWFATGDLGRLDEDGYLTVIGRRDNRFFSGGETIHPEEIERVLTDHDGVQQAVVVPIPDEEFGQRCVAFVQPRGVCPDGPALAEWLGQTLPRYKVPDAFYQWPATEANAFKVDRARFRRLAVDGPRVPLAGREK